MSWLFQRRIFSTGDDPQHSPPPINCAFFLRIPAKNPESPAYSIGGVARHDSFLLPLGLLKYSFFVI
jgi:hypothetical protein